MVEPESNERRAKLCVCACVYLVASRPGKTRISLGCSCEGVAFHNTIFNIWMTYGILKAEIFSMLTP